MNKLTTRQIKAAQLEATGMKAVDIAKKLKITPQTISAYRLLDEYQVLVSKFSKAAFRAAKLQLIEGASKAASTLLESMDSENENIRLKAAQAVLKVVGFVDLEDEIGATTIAELKATNMYVSSDLGLMKEVHKETDEFLSQFGF